MHTNDKVLKFVAKPIHRESISSGRGETNLGNRTVFTHALYRDDQEVGFDGGTYTVVRVEEDGSYYILCTASMMLPEGTISFQTFMQEIFPPPPFYASITGGTGAYRGISGEMHVDPASPETHYYTLYLD